MKFRTQLFVRSNFHFYSMHHVWILLRREFLMLRCEDLARSLTVTRLFPLRGRSKGTNLYSPRVLHPMPLLPLLFLNPLGSLYRSENIFEQRYASDMLLPFVTSSNFFSPMLRNVQFRCIKFQWLIMFFFFSEFVVPILDGFFCLIFQTIFFFSFSLVEATTFCQRVPLSIRAAPCGVI